MTEDEKRAKALAFMKAEQERMSGGFSADSHRSQISASLDKTVRKSMRQRAVFDALAQQGITWDDLKAAYDEAFKQGHDAMLDCYLAYFYAGSAIAIHERYNTTPEQCADFIHLLLDIAEEEPDRESLLSRTLAVTGVDTTVYDTNST